MNAQKPFTNSTAWKHVGSTNIHKIAYNMREQKLYMVFLNAKSVLYIYTGVGISVWKELLAAESKGEYHSKWIKHVYRYVAQPGFNR